MRACREAGFEPRIAFESDEYQVLQGLRRREAGLHAAADLALPTMRRDLVVRPTTPKAPERRVWAATRAKGARSAATDAISRSYKMWESASPTGARWRWPPESAGQRTMTWYSEWSFL